MARFFGLEADSGLRSQSIPQRTPACAKSSAVMMSRAVCRGQPAVAVLAADCELWADKAWHVLTIDDALRYPRDRVMRCRECHGQVHAHRAGGGQSAHFEHEKRHEGCSRSDQFGGIKSPHPLPARPRR